MTRKYRQVGYQDSGAKPRTPARRPRSEARRRSDIGAPSSMRPLQSSESFKCANCGAKHFLTGVPRSDEACPGCGAPLHSCFNCAHFDTSMPNECTQPIAAPIDSKRAANECPLYKPRIVVEISRATESPQADARAAFEALFKKS